MSRRTYPRLGEVQNPKNPQMACLICRAKPSNKVHIQVNWFRGEDLTAWLCKVCQRLGADALEAAIDETAVACATCTDYVPIFVLVEGKCPVCRTKEGK